jgi:hypothetical protein
MRNLFLYAVLLFVTAGFVHSGDEPEMFTFEHSFYAYFNKTKTTPKDNNIEAFIARMYENEYREHWRSNEFEKRRLIQKAEPQIKDGIAKFNSGTLFMVGGRYQLGDYDFKKEGFPMDSYPPYISANFGRASTGLGRDALVLVLSNVSNFNFLKMDPEKAEAFLSSHTDSSGMPDRDIILIFVFKVGENNDKRFTDYTNQSLDRHQFINGVIQRVEVWAEIDDVKIGELVR